VDADLDGGSVGTLGGNTLDVNDELLSVAADNFAFNSEVFVTAANNCNDVVFADGHVLDVVLAAELSGERSRHDDAALVGWCLEVCPAGVSS